MGMPLLTLGLGLLSAYVGGFLGVKLSKRVRRRHPEGPLSGELMVREERWLFAAPALILPGFLLAIVSLVWLLILWLF